MLRHVAMTAAAILVSVPAAAQSPMAIPTGSRVRLRVVSSGDAWIVGSMDARNATSVWVDQQEYPIAGIERIQVSEGSRSHLLTGLGLGAVGGAALGFGVGAVFFDGLQDDESLGQAIITVGGFAGGLVAGGIVGALTHTERWQGIPVDRLRVSVLPSGHGTIAVGIGVGF